jgi:hypothetical protein
VVQTVTVVAVAFGSQIVLVGRFVKILGISVFHDDRVVGAVVR